MKQLLFESNYIHAKNKSLTRITRSDLFLVAFCLYSITLLVESTTFTAILPDFFSTLMKIVRYFSYGLCVIKMLIEAKYGKKQLVYAITLIIIVLITLYTSDRTLAMLSFVFLGGVNVQKDKVLKYLLKIQCAVLTITVVSSMLGIIDNYMFDVYRGRWGLGFIWTTFAPILFMFIVFEYTYLYNAKMKLLHFVVLGLIATFLYFITKTRLSYAVTIFFLIISMIEHYRKKSWRLIRKLGKWNVLWPVFFAIFAIVLQISYNQDSEVWQKIDLLLSRRLYYGVNAIKNYKITAFGQKIEWIGHSYNTEMKGLTPSNDLIDNAYFRNLFLYGVIGLGAILSLYCIGIWKAIKTKDYFLVWVYIVTLAFCTFEFWMYNLHFNPFALIAVMNFSKNEKPYYLNVKQKYRQNGRDEANAQLKVLIN